MSKHDASIENVATLYVRNVPAETYAKLQALAAEQQQSVNAAILRLLECELERRDRRAEYGRLLDELKGHPPLEGPPWPEDIIREHRYGREPGFDG